MRGTAIHFNEGCCLVQALLEIVPNRCIVDSSDLQGMDSVHEETQYCLRTEPNNPLKEGYGFTVALLLHALKTAQKVGKHAVVLVLQAALILLFDLREIRLISRKSLDFDIQEKERIEREFELRVKLDPLLQQRQDGIE